MDGNFGNSIISVTSRTLYFYGWLAASKLLECLIDKSAVFEFYLYRHIFKIQENLNDTIHKRVTSSKVEQNGEHCCRRDETMIVDFVNLCAFLCLFH